ncbi:MULTISPECIES: Crp/Fnr family transcriptional regulator [unclassified Tenacibaculum]|uniref:Crp/Fnr family transcriptional regulator n=1 Tax=unclassified Tenacibaculum TaxID=2635139 RepID=UPI001F179EA2|nr:MULTISPECIES: Crp/Fnr family transcriptional regulator [unclassified Tenacibaculum]MCF2873505.1 Crp/Fnr family transcriptional regulator [Tenacibaculum sp. Cn5-1]MCF2933661.1 Crp/Fnr family transcriptional regulator [Tenacibaculum sp. Cn5-34]MCG7509757.1 Crp/Fnr family transcriptional regulator [Tenacibaculum sp. Cn5-46]
MILKSLINCKESTVRLIQSTAIKKKYITGDPILLKDVPINHSAIIIKGVLKAHLDQDDSSLLLYHISPKNNPLIVLMNMTENQASPISITAIEDSTLLWVPNDKVAEWESNCLSFKKAIINSSEHNISTMVYRLQNLLTHSLENRLFYYLKNKSNIYEQKDIRISRAEISSDLKTPKASISRAIKRLENQHKIIGKPRSIQLVV